MSCGLCRRPIASDEDYTVRACCGTRYHAGCIHRRYVSGPRACPKCGAEPELAFDEAPGSISSRAGGAPTGPKPSIFARIFGDVFATPEAKSARELIEDGWTWDEMRKAGVTKEQLIDHLGLDRELARRHAAQLKSVFGLRRIDWAKLRE